MTLGFSKGYTGTLWYTLPVRVAVACTDDKASHALSAAGANQMDPAGYLHLNDVELDIRPSKYTVFCRYDDESTNTICIDFQDGRWYELAGEPYARAKESLKLAERKGRHEHPVNIHITLLSSSAQWWTFLLAQLKNQLIFYVICLRLMSVLNQPKANYIFRRINC